MSFPLHKGADKKFIKAVPESTREINSDTVIPFGFFIELVGAPGHGEVLKAFDFKLRLKTNMAAYNTAANNNGPNGTSSDSDKAIPRIYVTNIHNNSGTVVLGEKNIVNVYTSPPSAVNARTTKNDATTDVRPKRCDHVPSMRGKRSLNDEGFEASSTSRQLCLASKREERRTEDSPVYEGGEFKRQKKKDRNRTKRYKRNSRSFTPSSDDETLNSALNAELTLESGNNSSFEQVMHSFHFYSKRLHPLRDNGCWAEFDLVAQELLNQTGGELTCQILICLEKAVSLSYQRKLEESEEMLNDEVSKIAQTDGRVRLLLEVLLNCYLAQLYRRRKLLGKTHECLEKAKKNSSGFPPCLAVAIFFYEEGSYKRDFAAMLHGPKKEREIAEAKKDMQCCVELCCGLDREKVYVGKQHFADSKLVNINLQCETSASRKENINSGNIKEAEKRLRTLRRNDYCKNEAQGAKIQRLKAEVDFNYRIHEFLKAEKIAKEALEIVQRLGFNLEKKPFEDRLKDIRRKMTESPESSCYGIYRETPRATDSSSGSPSSKNNSPQCSE